MNKLTKKIYYKRLLPHYQIDDMFYFITFRLAFQLPDLVLNKLKKDTEDYNFIINKLNKDDQKDYKKQFFKHKFEYIDTILDNNISKNHFLSIPSIAEIVKDTLHFFDNKKYELICYCIMPNHIHLILRILKDEKDNEFSLSSIMHSIKSFTSTKCNEYLNRKGQFWYHENYDHIIRNEEEFYGYIMYTINNPVKAKLILNWEDWEHTYVSKKYME